MVCQILKTHNLKNHMYQLLDSPPMNIKLYPDIFLEEIESFGLNYRSILTDIDTQLTKQLFQHFMTTNSSSFVILFANCTWKKIRNPIWKSLFLFSWKWNKFLNQEYFIINFLSLFFSFWILIFCWFLSFFFFRKDLNSKQSIRGRQEIYDFKWSYLI